MQNPHNSARRFYFGTSRSPSKLLFVGAAITVFAVLILVIPLVRAGRSSTTPSLHVLSMPYYSTKGDWDSVLTLNNATHNSLTASLTLYSLDGAALPLPDVSLGSDFHIALRLSDLIAKAQSGSRFQEGSIELRFNGNMMDLGAQLTVSDAKHGLSFDMEPPMAFKSSTLEGLWWSADIKTRGQVMLSNTTSTDLNLLMNTEWHGSVIPAQPISLSAHQTVVLEIEDLLKNIDIKAKGIERGGLSITHNGAPGALIAHGVVQNKEARFASNLSFTDPAARKSSVLNGTGLMLAHPASTSVFPNASSFVPYLALRNASSVGQTTSVTVQYTAAGQAHSESLPIVSLAPHEVRMVDFSALLSSLGNTLIDDAGLRIESSGSAGTLIAQLSSIDQNGTSYVDVPLNDAGPRSVGTGAHPFHLDGDSQAVVHLKNLADEPTTAIVQVLYDGGEFSPELILIQPGQSVSVDLRQLRDSRAKDVHGHQLPVDLTTGEVQWFQHGKQGVIGRLVASSPSLGVSASFACGGVCCPPSFSSSWVDPGSLIGSPGDSFGLTVWETDETCGQFYGPYNITAYASCTSTDFTVAQVSGSSINLVGDGFCTINVDHLAATFTRQPGTDCESGPCEIVCDETDTMMTDPVPVAMPITFIDVSEVGGTNQTDFVGGIPFASLNITSCGGERFGIKIRFRPTDLSTTISNVDSSVSSTGMFALAPSPVDGTYVEFFGNDNPPYTITYLRKVRSDGNRAVTHKVQGTSHGRPFTSQAVVTLVCQ